MNCDSWTFRSAPRLPRRHPLRRRLWKAGLALAAVIAVFITFDVRDTMREHSHKISLGHDLLPSYAAGILTRQGRPRAMFDLEAISAVECKVIADADLNMNGRYGPWLNPPFFAWVFVPLAALPYRQAAAIFLIVNLALTVVALTLLTRLFLKEPALDSDARNWKSYALVPFLTLLPLPFWQAMGHQQNTFISLTLLTIAVMCWRASRAFIGGLVTGLLFFKPQLGVVFALVFILSMGWRAFAGVCVTGVALLLITLCTMPGCLGDFLHRLPPILHWLQIESGYNWGRQVTFQSFWRLLIQGHVRGETAIAAKLLWWGCSGFVLLGVSLALLRFCTEKQDAIKRDRLIAAAIASMPMLMPYYMDYDLLLLAIPATLLAAEWIRFPNLITGADRWLVAAWSVFAVESHFNPAIATDTRWNLGVALLAMIALLQIRRCLFSPGLDSPANGNLPPQENAAPRIESQESNKVAILSN